MSSREDRERTHDYDALLTKLAKAEVEIVGLRAENAALRQELKHPIILHSVSSSCLAGGCQHAALQRRVEGLDKALRAVRNEEMAYRATNCFCVSWQGGGDHHPVCQQAMAALRGGERG